MDNKDKKLSFVEINYNSNHVQGTDQISSKTEKRVVPTKVIEKYKIIKILSVEFATLGYLDAIYNIQSDYMKLIDEAENDGFEFDKKDIEHIRSHYWLLYTQGKKETVHDYNYEDILNRLTEEGKVHESFIEILKLYGDFDVQNFESKSK